MRMLGYQPSLEIAFISNLGWLLRVDAVGKELNPPEEANDAYVRKGVVPDTDPKRAVVAQKTHDFAREGGGGNPAPRPRGTVSPGRQEGREGSESPYDGVHLSVTSLNVRPLVDDRAPQHVRYRSRPQEARDREELHPEGLQLARDLVVVRVPEVRHGLVPQVRDGEPDNELVGELPQV